jgi:hypothetical protein
MATTLRQFTPSPAVKSVSVDDNLVLMDQKSGQYFGLNEVGREIWRLLEEGKDAAAIVMTLATQFDATEEVLASDTHCLLDQLAEAGLTV